MNIGKIIASVLAFATVFASISFFALSEKDDAFKAARDESRFVNVCAHASYKTVLKNAVYFQKDDKDILTDLKYSTLKGKEADGWVGIKSYNGEADYRITITAELKYNYDGVSLFYARFGKSGALGADMPTSVKFYVSTDGGKFTQIGDASTTTDISGDNVTAIYKIKTKKGCDAKYIRIVIENIGTAATLINEIGAAAYYEEARLNDGGKNEYFGENGLIYRISEDGAEVIGSEKTIFESADGSAITPSGADFTHDGDIYYIGKGSETERKVISDFIGEGNVAYSGVPNNIKYIVIHNTGTVEEATTAQRYNDVLHRQTKETSWHYTVDENEIYHSLSDDVVGWHAGSTHNYESIGIEICVCGAPKNSKDFIFSGEAYDKWVEERFDKSLRGAAMLTAELLIRYGLSTDRIIQHFDVSGKNCPMWMRADGKKFVHDGPNWVRFMGYVENYYARLKKGSSVQPEKDIRIPEYILDFDGILRPVVAIGEGAFSGVITESVYIPASVKSISEKAFEGSYGIKSVEIAANSRYFETDGENIFDIGGDPILNIHSEELPIPSPREDCALDIRRYGRNYYVYFLGEAVTLKEAAKDYGAEVYGGTFGGVGIADNEKLSTGAVLDFDGITLYCVLRGDGNGDGRINANDYLISKRNCLGTYSLSPSQTVALAFTDGLKVRPTDYMLLKRHVMKTFDINK